VSTVVKRLVAAVLLLAFAGAPSLARAAAINPAPGTPAIVVETTAASPQGSPPARTTSSEAAGYAAREAAKPELGKFVGGSAVIYIGSGTLIVVLIVVLILLVL
jgi:hypothetical protein